MSNNNDIYFSIRNGMKRQVSKEEWEREWLRWWKKNSEKESSETYASDSKQQ
tara:strand:- start:1710 stop:1865 length:156 start_codon:yes stop_codon:yes gene_type:complete